jgi:hypothetical protein
MATESGKRLMEVGAGNGSQISGPTVFGAGVGGLRRFRVGTDSCGRDVSLMKSDGLNRGKAKIRVDSIDELRLQILEFDGKGPRVDADMQGSARFLPWGKGDTLRGAALGQMVADDRRPIAEKGGIGETATGRHRLGQGGNGLPQGTKTQLPGPVLV